MNILISNADPRPIYEQIYSQIRNAIVSGEGPAESPLPSIRSLAKDLRISVITTKRAYDELERDGYINTVAGKGCFVANIADREQQRVRIATDSIKTTVDRCVSLGFSASEVKELVTSAYTEVQPDVDKR